MVRRAARSIVILVSTVSIMALSAGGASAKAPIITDWTDPPSDEVLVDCGAYQIHEVSTFSARSIAYVDGTVRVHALIEGSLYRSDDPGTVIGQERARTVRLIEGSIAKVTGNRWHVVLYGAGMTVHDVGRVVLDFETREVFEQSGKHPVLNGDFDFTALCDL